MMIKRIYLLLFLISSFSVPVFAQSSYIVDHFSKDYYGKIVITDTSGFDSKGWVGIYDKQTDEQLIKMQSVSLYPVMQSDSVEVNVMHLPYGKQSVIMYDDFNFDGRKDFAIKDGRMSCYSGPSFSVYLASTRGFTFSEAFTQLSHDYCGMFRVNDSTQTLFTMTKSGCCWHQYSTFKVRNNKPYPIKIVEEQVAYSGPFLDVTEKNRIHGKMVAKTYKTLMLWTLKKDDDIVFSFKTGDKKHLYLINRMGDELMYVYTDSDGKVEMYFGDKFGYFPQKQKLWFYNGDVRFDIYPGKVEVTISGKDYTIKARPESINGQLSDIDQYDFKNVIVKATAAKEYDYVWKGTDTKGRPLLMHYQKYDSLPGRYHKQLVVGKILYPKTGKHLKLIGKFLNQTDASLQVYAFDDDGTITRTILAGVGEDRIAGYFSEGVKGEFTGAFKASKADTLIPSVRINVKPDQIFGKYVYAFGKKGPKGTLVIRNNADRTVTFKIVSRDFNHAGFLQVYSDTLNVAGTSFVYDGRLNGIAGRPLRVQFYKGFVRVNFIKNYAEIPRFGRKASLTGIFYKVK